MDKVTIVSPVAGVRFPNLMEHESFGGVTTGKYSLTLMFEASDKKVLEDAIVKAGGGKGKTPLKEIPEDSQYDAGKIQLKAKTTFMVKAVDATGNLLPIEQVSHGADARVKLTFQHYTQQGGGVTCYLGNIQLLSSGSNGDMDFGALPDGYEPGSDESEGEGEPLPF